MGYTSDRYTWDTLEIDTLGIIKLRIQLRYTWHSLGPVFTWHTLGMAVKVIHVQCQVYRDTPEITGLLGKLYNVELGSWRDVPGRCEGEVQPGAVLHCNLQLN